MQHINVAPTQHGFQVTALVRPPFEDMWQLVWHPAVFRHEGHAERFAIQIRKSHRDLDMRLWRTEQSTLDVYQGEGHPLYCPICV
jgi:hypothetical protein